jgi:hypothetical protein
VWLQRLISTTVIFDWIEGRRGTISWIRVLLNWVNFWKFRSINDPAQSDPLLVLRGSGKHLWADEHADEYVNRLRDDPAEQP